MPEGAVIIDTDGHSLDHSISQVVARHPRDRGGRRMSTRGDWTLWQRFLVYGSRLMVWAADAGPRRMPRASSTVATNEA